MSFALAQTAQLFCLEIFSPKDITLKFIDTFVWFCCDCLSDCITYHSVAGCGRLHEVFYLLMLQNPADSL